MDVFWFLPTHGDGHYLGTTQGARPVTLHYLKQVAQAADSLGYYGVLIPTGRSCEDSWLVLACTEVVNVARNQFFAGAGFTNDQHARITGRDLLQVLEQGFGLGVFKDLRGCPDRGGQGRGRGEG